MKREKGRKNLKFTINRNIYIVNLQKDLNLRLITVRLTLGYLEKLLLKDKEKGNGGIDKSLEKVRSLIGDSTELLEAYTTRADNWGVFDSENCRLLCEIVGICLEHDLLEQSFDKLSIDELLGVESNEQR